MNRELKNELTLVMTPARAAVLADHRSTVDLLVRVQAPPQPEKDRPARGPVHVALVVDRSGSMSGKPLAEAKRCARMVVDGLNPGDKATIVIYDDSVERLTDLLGMDQRDTLRRAIDSIDEGGCTNLHGGWLAGAETLAPHTGAGILSRVILLSDGCANSGITAVGTITDQVAQLADAGVTTSTYGLGRSFNEELMTAMADAGRGNAYYGQSADDLADPFQEELALMGALCAREVELLVETAAGVSANVLNGYRRGARGGWRLPDVAYEGEAWALVQLTVEAGTATAGEVRDLVKVRAAWRDLDGVEHETSPESLALPAMPAAAYAAVAEDELVRRRANELLVAGMQQTARDAARRHDWNAVNLALAQARQMARDNPWLEGVVEELEGLARQRDELMFAKEAMYSSRRMRSRMAHVNECQDPGSMDAPDYLRRKRAQGKAEPRRRDPR
jgi:Ca-activated chloride channel family protein